MTAFLGLGSNLGDRAGFLREAIRRLESPDLRVTIRSSVYETAAWGRTAQPPFLNQVVAVDTSLEPRALLERGAAVERALGRARAERWGPRAMDVDLLLYGDRVIHEPDLIVPHAELRRRAFVLAPLSEVAPGLRLPDGASIEALLEACPERSSIWRWDGRDAAVVGREIRWYETLPSTNDTARGMIEGEAELGRIVDGTVIIAEEQTAGRGRLGRAWTSPRGGVWLSVVLRPPLAAAQMPLVGFAGALAASEAIEATAGLTARLKWPNDVLIGGRKVAGVLLEAGAGVDPRRRGADDGRAGWVVVGIGLNANIAPDALPHRMRYPATSLQAAAGRPVDRGLLTQALLRALDRHYQDLCERGPAGLLNEWRDRADTLGRSVRIATAEGIATGLARDVDPDGALVVRTEDGRERRIVAGEVLDDAVVEETA